MQRDSGGGGVGGGGEPLAGVVAAKKDLPAGGDGEQTGVTSWHETGQETIKWRMRWPTTGGKPSAHL